jgi:hypothetical protein
MTFIIHPLFFYLLQVVDAIKAISIVILVTLLALAIIFLLIFFCDLITDPDGDKGRKKMLTQIKTHIKTLLIPTIICLLIATFCPDKSTIIQMTIATNATYENLEAIKGTAAELVNYIIDKTREI